MLTYQITGKNIDVSEAIESYIKNKVSTVEKIVKEDAKAIIQVRTYSDKSAKIKATIELKGATLHAEDTTGDLYAAIDNVSEKLERQARKMKTKRLQRRYDTVDVEED